MDSAVNFLRSTVARLALTYLAIIMLMSIGFSIVFYHTSAKQLNRQLPPSSFFENPNPTLNRGYVVNDRSEVESFFRQRADEGSRELRLRLIWLNLLALVAGGVLSYALARRTLKPIEEAMDAQTQFIGDASHELRTPLTAIKASNEVALRKPKLSLKEAKDIIKQNTEDVARLQTLSDGLLKLVNGKELDQPLSTISLQEVATESINQIVQLAQAKNISVDDQVPDIHAMGSKQNLVQATTILLDNAIKYSEPDSTITLNGSSNSKFAYLEVQDSGMGIRGADLPHIFKRFYRSDRSRSRQHYEGYGLGLSIADKLVKQQQGEISVKSKLGHGSTFTIKLHSAKTLS